MTTARAINGSATIPTNVISKKNETIVTPGMIASPIRKAGTGRSRKIRSVGGNVFGKIQAIIRRTTSTKNATDQEKEDNGDMGRRCARLLNVSLNKGIKGDSLFMATRSPLTRSRSLLPISAAKDT